MLNTERRNPDTKHIDKMSTAEMIAVMQRENENAVKAVGKAQSAICEAVDKCLYMSGAERRVGLEL